MKRLMSATFTVEGVEEEFSSVVPTKVSVPLETNGQSVWINRDFDAPGRGSIFPILTPKGWAQLGIYAESLRSEATSAWARMGSDPEVKL